MEQNIISVILERKKPSYTTTNNREIRVRCPYCGDSKKDASAAHLYIQTNPPFKFYCQKCTTSGALNGNVLKDLGIYDNELTVSIIEAGKNLKNLQTIGRVSFSRKGVIIPKVSDENNMAVQYFNNRFKSTFSGEELRETFKAITEPIKFFEENRIQIPSYYQVEKSIGFLSADNSHAVFRDITGEQHRRYCNVAFYEDPDASKIYNISTDVDVLQDSVELIMAEGIFDIIGVYNHFYKHLDNRNRIFSAACGKSYPAVVEKYIKMGFLNLKIFIYSDADVDIGFYKKMKASSIFMRNQITIYYNKKEKDFGVSFERIQLSKAII